MMLQVHNARPRKKNLFREPPNIGTQGTIRYGMFRHPCTVVQVMEQGRLVKVETTATKTIYVFTRQDDDTYKRRLPGYTTWELAVERPVPLEPEAPPPETACLQEGA
jgi:hypothetical protein